MWHIGLLTHLETVVQGTDQDFILLCFNLINSSSKVENRSLPASLDSLIETLIQPHIQNIQTGTMSSQAEPRVSITWMLNFVLKFIDPLLKNTKDLLSCKAQSIFPVAMEVI